jgi:NADH-quinone oxidoreductase subunit N
MIVASFAPQAGPRCLMFNEIKISELAVNLLRDVQLFLPEMVICAAIVCLLLLRMVPGLRRMHCGPLALGLIVFALAISYVQWDPNLLGPIFDSPGNVDRPFTGLLVYDHFTMYLRLILLSFAALTLVLCMLTGIPDQDDSADFCTLLLGGTLGMLLMASANHLLMVFIAVEMASLPSYALAGFLKGKRQSSEAALKYVVYGGGASGVMLYGISLIAGRFGTGFLDDLKVAFQVQLSAGHGSFVGLDSIVIIGLVFILVGLGFKLAAVPFHFWCPDVFEGAAAEVAAFLSVASKAAALALTGRLLLSLAQPTESAVLLPRTFGPVIAVFAALTATFGNLAAYGQTNLKRLLAYSTIAHAGYMLMGLAPLNPEGASAVLFYLVAYVFMNLGAFTIVALLRNKTGSEDLSSFRGLIYRAPILVTLLAVFLLSLLGMPPLFGFVAKFRIFQVLYHAGETYSAGPNPSLGYTMYALLVIGGLNTVLSLFYYVKVLKVMILEQPLEEVEHRAAPPFKVPIPALVFGGFLALMLFVGTVAFNPLLTASEKGVKGFEPVKFSPPPGMPMQAAPGGMLPKDPAGMMPKMMPKGPVNPPENNKP